MAAILKVWRQIENPTPSVDAYLSQLKSILPSNAYRINVTENDIGANEQFCQISSPIRFEMTESEIVAVIVERQPT